MSYTVLPTRTSLDLARASDINQLNKNIELLAGNSGSVPDATIQEVYNNIQCLFYPSYQNLTAKPNTSNPNYQVDVAWDELRIENRRTTSKSFTLDITQSGALGLDTGSEAVSTWYYIWAICNNSGSMVSIILSASAATPALPSGYTKKRLVSAVYNLATGHFRGFEQRDKNYGFSVITLISGGTSTSWTSIDITSIVPIISAKVLGYLTNPENQGIYVAANSSGYMTQYHNDYGITISSYTLPLLSASTVYYRVSIGSGSAQVTGCELNL